MNIKKTSDIGIFTFNSKKALIIVASFYILSYVW